MDAESNLTQPAGEARWRRLLFTTLLTVVSRGLMLRDAITGVARGLAASDQRQEFFFPSGSRRLSAVVVASEAAPLRLLLCHGIGERVNHWSAVQALLHTHGVGSMVFNYSGFGRSTKSISAEHCDEDFLAAYAEMRRRTGPAVPVFVAGFSLGSGIASAGLHLLQPPPAGLFLCEAFTSFREAAAAAGWPRALAGLVPGIWDTEAAMRSIRIPVCVLHSDADRLFPLSMPRRLAAACGGRGELVIVSGLAHDDPYLRPSLEYWGAVVDRILATASDADRRVTGPSFLDT